ncbi:WYL domain-containing protein [Desulfovibrio sp. OttesenSCG-928-O18]|nr:WYL domain-containing protein [Desulfovibrio sp. OttesenSCG-928-O18]
MILRDSRIRDLRVTDETFKRVMQEAPMATPDYSSSYELQRVVLRVAAEYAFRVFDEFPEQDIHPQPDGTFLIDEPMPINEWLTGYLLSFAEGLEVVEPAKYLERKNMFDAKEI